MCKNGPGAIPRLAIVAVLTSASLFLPSALAQNATNQPSSDDPDTDVVVLSPFEVSGTADTGYFSKTTLAGTRTNERLLNIPQNIQIINKEFLEDVNLDNGVDAFKYGASGINKKEATSGDTYIRGFRVGGNSFLRNGVKFRGNLNIPLYDIDRIEIIKGPAAMLFGGDAGSGGVVNYISKSATEKQEYYVKGTIGTFSAYRGEASASGPIGDSGFSYRATIAATNQDWRRRFDYFKDNFFSLATDYKVSSTTKISLYYTYYFLDQLVSTESLDTLGRFLDIPRDFSPQEAWAEAPRYTQYAYAGLTTAFTPTFSMRLFVNGSTQDFDFHQVFNARNPDAVVGQMNRTYQNYSGDEYQVNMQADMIKTFDTGPVSHRVTWGGTSKTQRLFQNVDNVSLAPINVYNPVYGTPRPVVNRTVPNVGITSAPLNRSREDFVYVHEQLSAFKGRLIVVGGFSWNGVNTYRQNRRTGSLTQQVDRAPVERYGFVYKPFDWMSAYYNYSESFQFFNNIFVGGPRDGEILDPSYTENNEFGVKFETSDGSLFGSIVAFDLLKTNVVVGYTQPDGTPGTRQSGFEENKGWEADIGVGFDTPGFGPGQLILTYYDGGSKDVNGNVPTGVTNEMWSAFVSQSVKVGRFEGLKFGGGVYHKGKFTMPRGSGQTVTFTAPAYTTSTAFVSYRRERFSLSLNVDNLTDEYYVDGGDSSGAMNMALGRIFRFTGEYRF